jgi:hypothetical protein
MAFDIERWRQRLLKQLAAQGNKQKVQAGAAIGARDVTGTTQSGAMTSAAEGIARAEAVEAAGINEDAAQMQHERAMELKAIEDAKKEAEKARKRQLIQGIVGLGLNIAGAPLLKGGTSLLGAGLSKIGLTGMKEAEQTLAGTQPVEDLEPPMSQVAPVAMPGTGAPANQQLSAMPLFGQQPAQSFSDWLKLARKRRPTRPAQPLMRPSMEDLQTDTRPWYLQ